MTARCTQYMNALKMVWKRKISRRVRKNRHITILFLSLGLFGGEIIFEVFQPMWSGYLNVTDGQTYGRYTVASPRGKTRETKCRRYYLYHRHLITDIDHQYMYTSTTRKFSYRPKLNETVWTVKCFTERRRTLSVRQCGYKIWRANYSNLSMIPYFGIVCGLRLVDPPLVLCKAFGYHARPDTN